MIILKNKNLMIALKIIMMLILWMKIYYQKKNNKSLKKFTINLMYKIIIKIKII